MHEISQPFHSRIGSRIMADCVGDENLCLVNSTLYELSTASVKLYVPLCAPTHSFPSYVAALVDGTVNVRALPASHVDTASAFRRNLNIRDFPWGKYRRVIDQVHSMPMQSEDFSRTACRGSQEPSSALFPL